MTTEQLYMAVSREQLDMSKAEATQAASRIAAYLVTFDQKDYAALIKSTDVPAAFKDKAKAAKVVVDAYEALRDQAKTACIGDPVLARELLTKEDIRDIFNKASQNHPKLEAQFKALLERHAEEEAKFLTDALNSITAGIGMSPELTHHLAVPGFGPIVANGDITVMALPVDERPRLRLGWARGKARELIGESIEDEEEGGE